jgi:hypothetical protein
VWDIGKRYFDLAQYREKRPQTREVSQEIRKVSGKEVEVPGIGSEDRIEVQVWKNSDLSRTVTVRPDGNISLPLIGDTPASGQTAAQLTETVTGKLKTYYKEPAQATVIVNRSNSYDMDGLGEVHIKGKHVVRSGTVFLQDVPLVRVLLHLLRRGKSC